MRYNEWAGIALTTPAPTTPIREVLPMAQPIALVKPDLFWKYVPADRHPDECWSWLGKVDGDGYGYHRQGSGRKGQMRGWRAHRVAYELLIGPIPDGLVIDHLCRNRACVNPAHMEPVTNAENIRRGLTGAHLRRTYVDGVGYICHRGHAMTPENTRVDNRGYTDCRLCARLRLAAWKARRVAA